MKGKAPIVMKPTPTKPHVGGIAVTKRPTARDILDRQAKAAADAKAAKKATASKTPAPAKASGAATHVAPVAPPAAPSSKPAASPPASASVPPPAPAAKAPIRVTGVKTREKGSTHNDRVVWCPSANTPEAGLAESHMKAVEGKNGKYTACPTCKKTLKVNWVTVGGKKIPRVPYHGTPNKAPEAPKAE